MMLVATTAAFSGAVRGKEQSSTVSSNSCTHLHRWHRALECRPITGTTTTTTAATSTITLLVRVLCLSPFYYYHYRHRGRTQCHRQHRGGTVYEASAPTVRHSVRSGCCSKRQSKSCFLFPLSYFALFLVSIPGSFTLLLSSPPFTLCH